MENFDLNFMNGVELTYCLDKYARGTVTIEIQNGETKLKDVDIPGFGHHLSNFDKIPQLKDIKFLQDDCFEIYPDLPMDENDHGGQIYFDDGSNEKCWFQDIESPLKEVLFESGILKGGGKLYYDIFWDTFHKEIWK